MIELISTDGTGFTVSFLNGLVQSLLDTFVGLKSQCISGLEITATDDLEITIGPGTFISTQAVAVADDIVTAVSDDSDQYVWIALDQAITFTDTWEEVTDDRVCLGKVTTVAGVITKVRYDRRMQRAVDGWDSEVTLAVVSGTQVLTPTEFTKPTIRLTGTLAGAVTLILPEWPGHSWTFNNQTNNTYAVKVQDSLGDEVTLATGSTTIKPTPEELLGVPEVP